MATRESNDGKIQLQRMGGLNERPAPNALPSPDFDICHGLYPARDGLLQRLEGKRLLATLPNGIRNIYQLDDGTGQIIIQDNAGNETIYSLDELFGRPEPTVNLTFTPVLEEDSMSMALLVHTEAAGTNGGSLNSGAGSEALNTWYRQKLTANTLNEDSIVSSFVAEGGGADENTWQLAVGDYRVEGTMAFNCNHRNLPISLGTFTVTIASPAVLTATNHNLLAGDAVIVQTSGTLPTGLTSGNTYYVLAAGLTTSTFRVSSTQGGAAVNTSGGQSGSHLLSWVPVEPTAVAVIYNETNSTVLAVSTPISHSLIPAAATGNPALTDSMQLMLGFCGAFSLAGTSKISVQAAVNSRSLLNWADDTTCRGVSHGVSTTIGGAIQRNQFTTIKIIKET